MAVISKETITAIKILKGLNTTALSNVLGISPVYLALMEKGHREIPKNLAKKILKKFPEFDYNELIVNEVMKSLDESVLVNGSVDTVMACLKFINKLVGEKK